jgi:hypothetical protein
MNTNEIIDNFFKLDKVLIDSPIKENLLKLREEFKNEINANNGGCTPCKRAAAHRKYTAIINDLINKND